MQAVESLVCIITTCSGSQGSQLHRGGFGWLTEGGCAHLRMCLCNWPAREGKKTQNQICLFPDSFGRGGCYNGKH